MCVTRIVGHRLILLLFCSRITANRWTRPLASFAWRKKPTSSVLLCSRRRVSVDISILLIAHGLLPLLILLGCSADDNKGLAKRVAELEASLGLAKEREEAQADMEKTQVERLLGLAELVGSEYSA